VSHALNSSNSLLMCPYFLQLRHLGPFFSLAASSLKASFGGHKAFFPSLSGEKTFKQTSHD
jgi:hypothetical protein